MLMPPTMPRIFTTPIQRPRTTGPDVANDSGTRCPLWLRRLGMAGFLFFLVKGLLWLLASAVLVLFNVYF